MNNKLNSTKMMTGSRLVGRLLRDLRKQRRLTGSELGRKAGLSQSKLSKLENGYHPKPQLADVDRLLNILDAPGDIRQKIYREIEREQPKALTYKPYGVSYGTDFYKLDREVSLHRQFALHLVPALLQTPAYRIALLERSGVVAKDLGPYMKDISRRQDLLWDSQHQFHFVLHETALYTVPANNFALVAPQFDRIERMMDLPNVKIGIIPLVVGLPDADGGGFVLHDRQRLFLPMADGEVQSEDEVKISLYSRIFSEMDRRAVYDEAAKKLVRQALSRV